MGQKGRSWPQCPNKKKSAGCVPQFCAPLYWHADLLIESGFSDPIVGEADFWNYSDPFDDPRITWTSTATLAGLPDRPITIVQKLHPDGDAFTIFVALQLPDGTVNFPSPKFLQGYPWPNIATWHGGFDGLDSEGGATGTLLRVTPTPFVWPEVPDHLLPWG